MIRPTTFVLISGLAFAGGAADGAGRTSVSHKDCEVTRILEDGREMRSSGSAQSRASVQGGSASASGAAAVSSRGSARSSASVSSSSSSASSSGNGSARAVSSYTDEDGRTVTTVHDGKGCRITIDERDISGEE